MHARCWSCWAPPRRGIPLLIGALLAGGPLRAQQEGRQRRTPPADAPPVAYPGIPGSPADTGRMAPGWHDFTRYDWVGTRAAMCEQAALQATERVWRHGEFDSAGYAAQALATTPPAVQAIVRACGVDLAAGVQLVRRGAPHPAFFAFFDVALALDRDDLARALLQGHLAHVPDPAERGVLLGQVLQAELSLAHPPRIPLIEELAATLDSLVRSPAPRASLLWTRMLAHEALWTHWVKLGDTARARAALEAGIAAWGQVPPVDGAADSHRDKMYVARLKLAVLHHGPRSPEVVAFLHRWEHDYGGPMSLFVVPALRRYGQPFVYPDSAVWYAPGGAPLGAPPPAGKVTLVWSPGFLNDHVCPAQSVNADACFPAWNRLHKLLARYGPHGLQLAILEHTRGYSPGAPSADLTPEQEAPAIRQFYQEQLGLTAYVAVETTPYKTKPAPDGRRLYGSTAWQQHYLPSGMQESYALDGPQNVPPAVWLVDQQGKVYDTDLWGEFGWGDGALLELSIRRLLGLP